LQPVCRFSEEKVKFVSEAGFYFLQNPENDGDVALLQDVTAFVRKRMRRI